MVLFRRKEMNTIMFRHWWALALRGILALLFGLVALFWPRLTLEVLVICFGAFAMISGIFALVVALGDRKMHAGWGVLLAEGLVGIGVGLLTLFWPIVTALILLSFIAIWALVTGGLEPAIDSLWRSLRFPRFPMEIAQAKDDNHVILM